MGEMGEMGEMDKHPIYTKPCLNRINPTRQRQTSKSQIHRSKVEEAVAASNSPSRSHSRPRPRHPKALSAAPEPHAVHMCMRWECLCASGGRSSPAPAVKNHTATAISRHELLVFGGYDGRRNHNTLHLLDCATRTWRELTHEARGAAPAGRNGHTATLAERKLFVLGGWLGSGPLAAADLHILHLDTLTWEQPQMDAVPGPCNMHTADYVPRLRAILVFRGGDGREYLNDLHALHIDTMTWRRVRAAGQAPAPRANHSSALVAHGDTLLVFGGWDGRQRLNDVHVLDIRSMAWSCVDTSGAQRNPALLYAAPPLPRAGMTMAQHRGKLFVFGGSGPSAKCYDDLHVYDPTHHRWVETVAVASSDTARQRRYQQRQSSIHQRRSRQRARPTLRRPQPRWDIYEDEEEGQEERSWSVEDQDDADEDEDENEVDEVDSDSNSNSNGDSEDDAMIAAQGLSDYGLDDGANPNEMTEYAVSAFKPSQKKRENPLLVVGHGPGQRAGHTCSVVGRLLVIFGGSCGADYLNDCFALDTDPPPRAAVSLPSPAKMLRRALAQYVDCEAFSDISFLVEGRVVFAHKLILSALSERFRVMFSSGFREAHESQIPVLDVRYEVFLLLLEYLYTGRVALQADTFALTSGSAFTTKCQDLSSPNALAACPQSADGLGDNAEDITQSQLQSLREQELELGMELETMLELLLAADQFMLDHLKQRCEHALQHAVALPTVETIAEAADRANARQLQAVCCHFLRNHPLACARRGLDGSEEEGNDEERATASDEENDVDGEMDEETTTKETSLPCRSQAAIL